MSDLRVSLFGNVRIEHGRHASRVKITKVVTGLMAYLLVYRQREHSRDVLAGIFWPDSREDLARKCLSTALWRLRRVLEPGKANRGKYLITRSNGEVGFNRESDYWLDVEEFEGVVAELLRTPVQSMQPRDAERLEATLKLHAGELMEGYYDDWTVRERDRLRGRQIKGLEHLMGYHEYRKHFEQALSFGLHVLHHDPLREEIHREVMRLYAQSGQRTKAIRHYESCCRLLGDELGVGPMGETRALYEKILQLADGGLPGPSRRRDRIDPVQTAGLDHAFSELRLAMHDCGRLHSRLNQVNELLLKLQRRSPPPGNE